jgi:HAD superfamily hydrolase (TIGR01662 family)
MNKIDLDNIALIIFDLDGVIYDISEALNKAVEDGVEKYKLNIKIDDVLQEIAHLIEDIQHYPVPQIILQSYDLLQVDFLEGLSFFKKLRIAVFLFNQFNEYREDSTIFKGIDEIIEELSDEDIKLAILTNNKSVYAEEVLERFNLKEYFPTIIGFNDVSNNKPDPEGILKILEKWEVPPKEAIFIGDMTTDIQAGKAAGVTTISFTSGLAEKEKLLEEKPDYLVESTDELKVLLDLKGLDLL